MADSKNTTKTTDDAGQAEVQKAADEVAEQGYVGTVPDQPANEEYSLESGPDGPDEHAVARGEHTSSKSK